MLSIYFYGLIKFALPSSFASVDSYQTDKKLFYVLKRNNFNVAYTFFYKKGVRSFEDIVGSSRLNTTLLHTFIIW